MPNFFQTMTATLALAGMFLAAPAQSAIQLSSTRAIMTETDASVSVYAKNLTDAPFVVQAWIEGEQEEMETPFFITPPLSRFDPQAERSLNITRVGGELPGDRESFFWINVLEIPQKTESNDNSLTLATRTRIKLFYRPSAILNEPRGEALLDWSVERDGNGCRLAIRSTTVYTTNFSGIQLAGEPPDFGRTVVAKPLTTTYLPLSACPQSGTKLVPQVVNDYGVAEDWSAVTLTAP